jgi:hypothetical protein
MQSNKHNVQDNKTNMHNKRNNIIELICNTTEFNVHNNRNKMQCNINNAQ